VRDLNLNFLRQFTLLIAKETLSVFCGTYFLVIFPLQDHHCKIIIFLSRNRSSSSFIRNRSLCCYLIAYQEKKGFLYNVFF